ncbi:MAG: 3-phosphoshikimate 1-carboxyvinyltransferase, partial [Acholeplasmatales bacterium]|nr:3-phosphoshikimate 1-carboxyvinyltransferase [Acholeplasmatales bacterium]
IIITTNLESKGYIDLTLDVLKTFGIDIINNDYKEFIIKGNQEYMPHDYNVEGDFSQAAFFLVANCLGANFNLRMMDMNSHQGDKKILKDLEDFGANITYKDSILSCNANELKGSTIDFSQSPDLGPALTVLAALSNGRSDFINASRLRIKECDRITCMKNELEKLGAIIEELPDGMIIYGVNSLHGGIVDSCNDHRVAMAIAMASLKCDGEIKILNASCVSKSFPHFWKVFESLGGVLEYEE